MAFCDKWYGSILTSRNASSHLALGSSNSQAISRKLLYGSLNTTAVMPFSVTHP